MNPLYPLRPLPPALQEKPAVHDPGCYICKDPDYARFGLPLCYPCPSCGAHVAADEGACSNCNWTAFEDEYQALDY